MDTLFNLFGVIGMALLLSGYFLQQQKVIAGDSPEYLGLNLAGCIGLIISLLWFWNLPVFLLECIWALISLYGLVRWWMRKA
jgi:hypothetical protein